MPYGFSADQWQTFTKTERWIIQYAKGMGFNQYQIRAQLEIKASTFRVHLGRIRRKIAQMRADKAEEQTKESLQKYWDLCTENKIHDLMTEEDKEKVLRRTRSRLEGNKAVHFPVEGMKTLAQEMDEEYHDADGNPIVKMPEMKADSPHNL